jgi:putative ABC transport system permease protein
MFTFPLLAGEAASVLKDPSSIVISESLASYLAEQRTREIGIRKVLGSSAAGIVTLLNREFLKWVAAAGFVAWPVAYLAVQAWIRKFAYRAPITPWVFILSTAFALIVALLTVSLQTLKAARANPVDSLKYE